MVDLNELEKAIECLDNAYAEHSAGCLDNKDLMHTINLYYSIQRKAARLYLESQRKQTVGADGMSERVQRAINGLGANPCNPFDCFVIDVIKELKANCPPADVLKQVAEALDIIANGKKIDYDTWEVIDQEDMEQIAKKALAALSPYIASTDR